MSFPVSSGNTTAINPTITGIDCDPQETTQAQFSWSSLVVICAFSTLCISCLVAVMVKLFSGRFKHTSPATRPTTRNGPVRRVQAAGQHTSDVDQELGGASHTPRIDPAEDDTALEDSIVSGATWFLRTVATALLTTTCGILGMPALPNPSASSL
ncbi:hypothetical protein C2E23DRAFT_836609 [Lenzites betulinus]|nr:hypothetical protein C2E23DRAFT_836609 [Lenzites betulinus]